MIYYCAFFKVKTTDADICAKRRMQQRAECLICKEGLWSRENGDVLKAESDVKPTPKRNPFRFGKAPLLTILGDPARNIIRAVTIYDSKKDPDGTERAILEGIVGSEVLRAIEIAARIRPEINTKDGETT